MIPLVIRMPEPAVAQAELFADAQVGGGVVVAGGVREALGVEALALVGDDELHVVVRHLVRIVTSSSFCRRLPHSIAFSIISSAA